MRVSWAGEVPCAREVGLDRVWMRACAVGAPQHVGWVPAGLGSEETTALTASAIPELVQEHAVLGGECWTAFARPRVGAWVVVIARVGRSPVWWSGPAGAELWLKITDLIGMELEMRETTR